MCAKEQSASRETPPRLDFSNDKGCMYSWGAGGRGGYTWLVEKATRLVGLSELTTSSFLSSLYHALTCRQWKVDHSLPLTAPRQLPDTSNFKSPTAVHRPPLPFWCHLHLERPWLDIDWPTYAGPSQKTKSALSSLFLTRYWLIILYPAIIICFVPIPKSPSERSTAKQKIPYNY